MGHFNEFVCRLILVFVFIVELNDVFVLNFKEYSD